MRNSTGAVIRAVGAPARISRKSLAGRRSIFWACWALCWTLVLWDIWLSLDGLPGNTWSEVMRGAALRNPVLPWLFGALLSHLFHVRDDLGPVLDQDAANTVMGALTLAFIALGIGGVELSGWLLIPVVVLGMAAAHFLWPKLRQGEWHW